MATETWVIDASHSLAEFSVRHMMFATVKGSFGEIEGTITGDIDDLTTTSVNVTIPAASVNTHNEDRDQHLRSGDFFDVENHPNITFQSKGMRKKQTDNEFELEGDLTIRGVTKPVTLDVTFNGKGKDPWGNERVGFSAKGVINRKDFGLNWNTVLEAGGVLVGDEVKMNIEVQAVKQ